MQGNEYLRARVDALQHEIDKLRKRITFLEAKDEVEQNKILEEYYANRTSTTSKEYRNVEGL